MGVGIIFESRLVETLGKSADGQWPEIRIFETHWVDNTKGVQVGNRENEILRHNHFPSPNFFRPSQLECCYDSL